MKLSLNLKSVGAVTNILKNNFSIVLWVFLGLIALLTGLVIFREVGKVSQVQTDTSGILDKIVRVNLGSYQALEKRLGENSSFRPGPIDGADSFGPAPIKKVE